MRIWLDETLIVPLWRLALGVAGLIAGLVILTLSHL
jgi:hypothetical protein